MQRSPVSAWQELSALYEQAEDLHGAALDAWLAALQVAGHGQLPALRRMLAAREQLRDSDFLNAPPRLTSGAAPDGAPAAGPDTAIGPYRLLRPLGAGGMAEVWLAERSDGAFRRRVAIKLMFRQIGGAARDGVTKRFARERDILASLDHPNIAALHDAGVTPAGQPWLALEYVEGRPLTDWCDEARLGIADRVHLFRQVLLAVQHAHANLVMHRDLKPANILVGAQGEVRLLDFGIAKLLEPGEGAQADTELTRAAGRMLTPLYASPEQLRGEPLTIACDVYALGVVLYELLSGERPYEVRAESVAQLEQAILEADPKAPSRRVLSEEAAERRGLSVKALRKALAGDLDAITLQALAKQPARRYASVEALLADLDRWLGGEAVKAHAPSAVYRWGKFVRRNRLGVGLGTGAMLALAGVATVAVIQGQQAQRESARAVAARDFMIDMFRRADPEKARGTSITAGELLDSGRADVERKLQLQPELQVDLLEGIASIQTNMGDYTKAAQTYAAVERLQRQLGRTHELVIALADQAGTAGQMGDVDKAAAFLAEARRVNTEVAPDERLNARLAQIGGVLASDRSDHETARRLFNEAVTHAASAYGLNHIETLNALRSVANVESDAGKPEAAARVHADILARAAANPAIEPRQRAEFAYERVRDLYDAGRVRDALAAAEPASNECDVGVGPYAEPCRRLQQIRVQSALRLGWPDRALPVLAQLTATANDALSPARQAYASALLLRLRAAVGRNDDADGLHDRLRRLAESGSEIKVGEQPKVTAALALADSALLRGDAKQALHWTERALRREPNDAVSARVFAWGHALQGIALMQLGAIEPALVVLRRAHAAHATALGELHPMTLLFSLNEARALHLLGRTAEGMSLVQRAGPGLREAFGADSPTYLNVIRLQALFAESGSPSIAAKQTVDAFPRGPGADSGARLIFN
jgi:serine/threonine protein kinase